MDLWTQRLSKYFGGFSVKTRIHVDGAWLEARTDCIGESLAGENFASGLIYLRLAMEGEMRR
jgi:hypothetical protein